MLVSRITRANYHSAAVHADLDRILSIHDAESVEYLQLILGAALTGYADHRLTLLQGPGGNGKTSLIGALAAAMCVNFMILVSSGGDLGVAIAKPLAREGKVRQRVLSHQIRPAFPTAR